ncbi:MAG: hypothetical protein ABFD63_09855 [Smithella sp.]
MNTVVENWISYEDMTEEPGIDCRACDKIVEAHSTNSRKIFSTVNSSVDLLKSQANGLVSDFFRRSQAADSNDIARLEAEKNVVRERLKREMERIDMENNPYRYGDTWFCV